MQRRRDERERLGLLEQDAALALQRGVEQRRELLERRGGQRGERLGRPAAGGERDELAARRLGQEEHDLLEAEGVADGDAHGVEHLLRAGARAQLGGDPQQVLDGGAMAHALLGALRVLDRHRGVGGDGAEDLELVVAGAPAGERLVDREDAEHGAVGCAQRHEQRILGVPGVGPVGRPADRG